MSLVVPDPDALMDRAVAAGGRVIFQIANHDPAGHHWLIGKYLSSTSRRP